jgi:hypothetical protein
MNEGIGKRKDRIMAEKGHKKWIIFAKNENNKKIIELSPSGFGTDKEIILDLTR